MTKNKICKTCKTCLPDTDFYPTKPGKRDSSCKFCRRRQTAERLRGTESGYRHAHSLVEAETVAQMKKWEARAKARNESAFDALSQATEDARKGAL